MSENTNKTDLYDSFTRETVTDVVHSFYGKVQNDPHIGDIFNERIDDWPYHLNRMVNFWSGILYGERNYTIHPRGTPPMLHMAISELEVDHFETWLGLWYETSFELFTPPYAEVLVDRATNIARNLSRHLRMDGTPPPQVPHA